MLNKLQTNADRLFSAVLRSLGSRERGASMVEYALLLALLAVVVAAAISGFGNGLQGEFEDINSDVDVQLESR